MAGLAGINLYADYRAMAILGNINVNEALWHSVINHMDD